MAAEGGRGAPPPAPGAEQSAGMSRVRVGTVDVRLLSAGPPDQGEAVVFVHGNPGSAQDWARLVPAAGAVTRAVALDLPDFGDTAAPSGFQHTVPGYAAFLDRMYDHYDRRTRRAVLELYRATDDPGQEAPELAAALRERDVPALVIWGEHDAYLPASFAARQRELVPNAEVHVLPGSGHWPFIDAADVVERLLVEFVRRQP